MVAQNMDRSFYAYISDDGNTYQVGTTIENGTTANGATPVTYGANPVYPRGWKMRHLYGINAGLRTKAPIFDPSNAKWTGGTTSFTKNSTSYSIEGRVGEKRFAKS